MLKCTCGEFIMILYLIEILFPDLCLFLIINMYIKICKAFDMFVGFLDLFWIRETVGESWGPEVLY
jgi:hypothetical protein